MVLVFDLVASVAPPPTATHYSKAVTFLLEFYSSNSAQMFHFVLISHWIICTLFALLLLTQCLLDNPLSMHKVSCDDKLFLFLYVQLKKKTCPKSIKFQDKNVKNVKKWKQFFSLGKDVAGYKLYCMPWLVAEAAA